MQLRALFNRHPRSTLGILSGIVFVAVAFSVWTGFRAADSRPFIPGVFYTDDDGKTLFQDAPGLVTPFDHNGKLAVMAMVYTADHGQHRWVQYLQKYSDASAQKLTSIAGTHGTPTPSQLAAEMPEVIIKKPGASKWLPLTDPAARQLMEPALPEGMGSGPIELAPR